MRKVEAITCCVHYITNFRKSMEKQGVNDHMDALLLLLDEIVDRGYVRVSVLNGPGYACTWDGR